ncbi:hypothetical protein F2P45_05655 [Massilia sp. CCM 8733]|uniref:Antitoxin Xre-like helix-turn-helix domain-containing protein n=1 Tax=Massilia mucilaginosa TaxID=2609282 RepID=A0ABX0NNZ6_9BURK|nr:antitoxin Xre-like helix-turn-helix domain-containing protein [Massilia mucilaginosa]NHZ88510.1 hypothetical protein [Massilia mucilaginosa]
MAYSIIDDTSMLSDTIDDAFAGDTSVVISRLRSGTPASVISALASRFGITQERLLDHLRLPPHTLTDRIHKNLAVVD